MEQGEKVARKILGSFAIVSSAAVWGVSAIGSVLSDGNTKTKTKGNTITNKSSSKYFDMLLKWANGEK